jgi:hypothetical protein
MTVAEALRTIRQAGTVESSAGKLKVRIPETSQAVLQGAIDTLRHGKAEALALLAAEVEPSDGEVAYANAILGRTGCRLMRLEASDAIGIWSDLDSPAIRNALHIMGSGELPVYLDGPNVPLRYKLRRVPGEPVPSHVRLEMERSAEPWKVRNRMACKFVPWPFPKTMKGAQ